MSVFFTILFASYFFSNDKPSTGFVAGGGLMLFGGKVSSGGDAFTRVFPIPVPGDGEFRLSAVPFPLEQRRFREVSAPLPH